MKRTVLLASSTLFSVLLLNAQVLISEDFESYEVGSYLAESAGSPWSTWDNAPGTEQDAMISNEQASSGNNSVVFTSDEPEIGGPGSILVHLGNQTGGIFELGWNMYIPAGSGGSFNIQHDQDPGQWGLIVTFRANNAVEITTEDTTFVATIYPQDQWFSVNMLINMNVSLGTFHINEGDTLIWNVNTSIDGEPTINQLGAVNFSTFANGDPVHFYIDDLYFEDLSTVGVGTLVAQGAALYPNPVSDILTVVLADASNTTLLSVVDLTGRTVMDGRVFRQQGAVTRTEMDMKGLPQGVYLVRIQDGAEERVYRVVKK